MRGHSSAFVGSMWCEAIKEACKFGSALSCFLNKKQGKEIYANMQYSFSKLHNFLRLTVEVCIIYRLLLIFSAR